MAFKTNDIMKRTKVKARNNVSLVQDVIRHSSIDKLFFICKTFIIKA